MESRLTVAKLWALRRALDINVILRLASVVHQNCHVPGGRETWVGCSSTFLQVWSPVYQLLRSPITVLNSTLDKKNIRLAPVLEHRRHAIFDIGALACCSLAHIAEGRAVHRSLQKKLTCKLGDREADVRKMAPR